MSNNYLVHIVAVDQNNAIGNKDQLLFRIPNDLKQFKALTLHSTVVAGTNTIKTLPELKQRYLVHLTRKGIKSAYSQEMVDDIKKVQQYHKNAPIFIIGGGEVYKETLDKVSVIMLTRILSTAKEADTYYPDFMQLRKPTYSTKGIVRTCPETGVKYQFEVYGYDRQAVRDFMIYKQSRLLERANVKR